MKNISEKIVVENVSKTFSSQKILDNVNFEICPGNVLTILGPNGAGKTTILKVISGLIGDIGGRVYVKCDGKCRQVKSSELGLLFEGNRTVYHKLTPLENLTYFGVLKGLRRNYAKERAHELLALFNLEDKANVVCQKLSRGMQQRIALAVAVIHKPKFVLLDEPTLGMDYKTLDIFNNYVRSCTRNGTAFIISTHQYEIAQLISSHTLLIKKGKVIASEKMSTIFGKANTEQYKIQGKNEEVLVNKSPQSLQDGIQKIGLSNLTEISQTKLTLEELVRQKTDDTLH